MPTPISELIATNILATVQGVTTANGYTYNLTAERHKRSGDKRHHLHCVIIAEDPHEVMPTIYNCKEWTQVFNIGCFIVPPELDDTPIDTYVNVIAADLHKAIMVDRYRGANALDTQIRATHVVTEDGLEYDLAIVNVEVNYRTNEVDPYQNAG